MNLHFHFIWQFSVDDLKAQPNQTTCWDGVRNYQVGAHGGTEIAVGGRWLCPQLVPVPEAFPFGALCLFIQVHFGGDLKLTPA